MITGIESMLGETPWVRRAKRLKRTVTVRHAESPYPDDMGSLELDFKDPAGPTQHPEYPWFRTDITSCNLNLSIMPEGCGMIVVSSLWGFTKPNTNKFMTFTMDLLVEYARRHVVPDQAGHEETWARTLLATTNTQQRRANTYFRRNGWKVLTTTKNPRGTKMWLWEKKL